MQSLRKGVTVENESVYIDPLILFTRLTVLAERTENVSIYLKYELAPIPTALFKDSFMRKPQKSTLANYLTSFLQKKKGRKRKLDKNEKELPTKSVRFEIEEEEREEEHLQEATEENDETNVKEANEVFVIDGGCLLHRVVWFTKGNYEDVIKQYSNYIKSKYGESVIVFDGYLSGPSTKDHEHRRRMKGNKGCANINVAKNMKVYESQNTFLANDHNKKAFIDLLKEHLEDLGYRVVQSSNDADTLIVSTAIDLAITGKKVVVVADDSDVLIVLLYYWNTDMGQVNLLCRKSKGTETMINISVTVGNLDRIVLKSLLFIHAFGGCDTTSAIHGKGKTSVINLLQKYKEVQEACDIFMKDDATKKEVTEAGHLVFVLMYGGRIGDTLSDLRYINYKKHSATSQNLLPEILPPSEAAVKFHSWRVHLQVKIGFTYKNFISNYINISKKTLLSYQ